jgi:hypothetical protein
MKHILLFCGLKYYFEMIPHLTGLEGYDTIMIHYLYSTTRKSKCLKFSTTYNVK